MIVGCAAAEPLGTAEDTERGTLKKMQQGEKKESSHRYTRVALAMKMAATILHRPSTLNGSARRVGCVCVAVRE